MSAALRGRECLRALRTHVALAKKPPRIEGEDVVLMGDATEVRFPVTEETGYESSREGEGAYQLGTVALLVMLQDKKMSEYIAACMARNWKAVSTLDRPEILGYVNGTVDAPARLRAEEPEQEQRVRVLHDHTSWCVIPGADFTFALDIYDTAMRKGKDRKPKDAKEAKPPKKPKKEEPPREPDIIIVPGAMTSVITLLNAGSFLEKGHFVSNADVRKTNPRKETAVEIQRTRPDDGALLKYRVIDNPTRLTDKEWRRVVAVFAMGPTWQFKGWRYDKPVDLFQRVLGVHLHFDDEATNANIKSWNVSVLKLSKSKRHLDQPVSLQFWRLLDDFVIKRKQLKAAASSAGGATTSGSSSSKKAGRHHRSS